MKEFFKMTFATICGIAIFMVLTGLFFVISLAGMLASEAASTVVKDNSVFVIKLEGTVSERAPIDDITNALMGFGQEINDMGLDDLIASIRKAKDKEQIKGIYLEGGSTTFDSPATAQQLRDALADFKKSGKWIVAYADDYSQGNYYVASVADKVYLNGEGVIDFKGLGGQSEYMKGLYDKIGVRYQAAKVGKYKSYVESNTLTGMSDYDREQRTAYLQGIWNYWLKAIGESRKVKAEQLNQLANDSILYFAKTQDYVSARLVDKIIFPEELQAEIRGRLGLDKDDEIAQLTLTDMMGVKAEKDTDGGQIAVYYAYGSIVNKEEEGLLSYGEHLIVGKDVAEDLRKLADDDDVKAVVFRVNSGGGSAVASEQIRHAVKLVKAKKPIVVSMGGAAASGGYWISSPANYIVAEPTTITGSIGIFGLIPNLNGLLTDKLGINFDGVKTNKYTDYQENLVLAKDNTQEIAFLQHYIDRGYTSFLNIVSEGRGMKPEEVDSIAQGRVWLASDAVKIKLVDKLGSLDDAVRKAAELAKLDKYHTDAYPVETADWMEELFPQQKGSYLDAQLREMLGELYQPLMELRRDARTDNRIQAKMLENIKIK